MSEQQKNKKDQNFHLNKAKNGGIPNQNEKMIQSKNQDEDMHSGNEQNRMTYSQARDLCESQMQELQQKIQDLDPEEQQQYIEEARAKCQQYLAQFKDQPDESNEEMEEEDSMTLAQQQIQMLLAQQQFQSIGLEGLQSQFNATATLENPNQQIQNDDPTELMRFQEQALQQQQANLLFQQMGQKLNQKELFDQVQTQYKQALRQQMGNQLRNFARQMFSKMNQRQKKKLHKEAKQYLDLYIQDQKKLQEHMNNNSTNPSMIGSGNAYLDSSNDFEYQADPQKYLDEVEGTLRKHKDLEQNFQRFIQKVFDDPEQEQVFTDFMINYQEVYTIYHNLAINYTYAQTQEDDEKQEMLGTNIFNLIMPLAQKLDPKLLNLIPKETLEKFKIEYESDNIHIKSWDPIVVSHSNSSNSEDESEDSGTGSEQSGTSNEHNISSNSQVIGDSSDQDGSHMIDDTSNDITLGVDRQKLKDKGHLGYQYDVIPQSALTGKHKSLNLQLTYTYPNFKNIKSNDLRPLENLFKSLKDEKDWIAFCKLLKLYMDGVTSFTEFLRLFEEKFANKLKLEIKDEIEKLIPTRDQNRRQNSNLLKPWNDIENQTFDKIPDSSYFKIEEGFPIPTCTRKMMEEIYWKNINDQYLSLATGSENFKFKFRNTNEEQIYKTEDKLYELDSQIDNITKSCKIVSQECDKFDLLSELEQANYKFPCNKLNPLRFYWDQRFRKQIHDQYFKEGKVLKAKEMASLKQTFNAKLEFLKNQKLSNLNEYKDHFRKNFTKSLDHKSFQYKDFIKKYLLKQNHIKWIKQILEDNYLKKRLTPNEINYLYGSGDQSVKSNYRFYNTFGKDFSGKFDPQRLEFLDQNPDYPIDMKFMDKIKPELIQKLQSKFPQARFLFNNEQALEISLKLLIQFIKLQIVANAQQSDKSKLMKSLKFMMENFLLIDNFDDIEVTSETIQPLSIEMVDILMNSALYYQKKYTREIGHMEEVFPIEDPSINQSPLKNISMQNSEIKQQQTELSNRVFKLPQSSDSRESEANCPLEEDISIKEDPIIANLNEFKSININRVKIDEEQQLLNDIFIPRYIKPKDDSKDERYQLFYGPLNLYMFLVYFYSIYERIIKAKELVSKKVIQDFKDDFSQMEWSLKFKSRTKTIIDERFSYLIKAILTLMSQNNILDSQKYEDIARELLGNDAYLLFQIDKLINYCQKSLSLFETDHSCKAARRLFDEFKDGKMDNESEYLSNFYKQANKSALISKDLLNQQGNEKQAVINKENTNPNMNLQSFRIMFSPKSKIMTIHFMVLHPFFMQDQKKQSSAPQPILYRQPINPINGDINEEETVQGLVHTTVNPMQLDEEPLPQGEVDTSPQIYLNRNLRRMRKIRNKEFNKFSKNKLQLRVIPITHSIAFIENTEDIVEFRRPFEKTKTQSSKRRFSQLRQDKEYHLLAQKSIIKRLKTINDENGQHQLNELIDQYQLLESPKKTNGHTQNNPEVDQQESVIIKPAQASVTTRKTRSVANSNQKQNSRKGNSQGVEDKI